MHLVFKSYIVIGSIHKGRPHSGLATSDIISSSSPSCYKIYWFVALKDLFVSDMFNNFVS